MKSAVGALVLVLFAGAGAWAETKWYVPGTLATGTANEVYAWDATPVEPFTVLVFHADATKPISSVHGVLQGPLVVDDRSVQWSSALVGIEAAEAPGPVVVQFRAADGRILASVPSQIVAQSYAVEDLRLDRAMSQLRAQPDPRKDQEAEAIWKIYLSFHPWGPWGGGRFRLPVDPGFGYSAHFGDTRRYLYSDGTSALDVHRGLDFAVPVGTPVSAPAPGVVALVAARKLTGTTVVLEHAPGVYSIYFHLSQASVRVGQRVNTGDRLALSGATGLVTGPHLHWEVKVGGVSVDPLGLVVDGLLDTTAVAGIISSVEHKIP